MSVCFLAGWLVSPSECVYSEIAGRHNRYFYFGARIENQVGVEEEGDATISTCLCPE